MAGPVVLGKKRKRFTELQTAMCLRCSIPEIDEILPRSGEGTTSARLIGSLAIGGILDGLALNHLFEPGSPGQWGNNTLSEGLPAGNTARPSRD